MGRTRRHIGRSERGSSMLVATGLIAVITVGTLVSLQLIQSEAEVQGGARRERQAFFAAQAGLAEARERVRQLVPPDGNYSTVIAQLKADFGGNAAPDIGDADHPWFDVLCRPPGVSCTTTADRWTSYSLTTVSGGGTEGSALDDTVTTSGLELHDSAGNAFRGYPTNPEVYYRVFLRDDEDEKDPSPRRPDIDSNKKVWLVAVGEVRVGKGQPVRSVVQALVSGGSGGTLPSGEDSQAGRGASKSGSTGMDANLPDVSVSRSL